MTRRIIWLGAAALLLAAPALAGNPPAIEWQRTFGPRDTSFGEVLQLAEGGYALGGRVLVAEAQGHLNRPCLGRLDPAGNVLWLREYGGALSVGAGCLRQTPDRGFVFVADGGDSVCTFAVVKTDSLGNIIWSYWNDEEHADWLGGGLCLTSDGGYVVSGFCAGDSIFLLKLDSEGARVWTKRFHEPEYRDWAVQPLPVKQASDGGFVLGSQRLLRTDSAGIQLWRTGYDSVYVIFDVVQTPDGGYAATGVGGDENAPTERNLYQVCLLKTNSQGTLLWRRLYSHSDDGSMGLSLAQTSDGGYLVSGEDGTGMLAHFDSQGSELWYLTGLNGPRWAGRSQQTADGGYVVIVCNRVLKLAPESQ